MIPKINSSHGSETRNIINAAIDSINTQGKSIQDLVAKGQLTPAQYANLIQAVNGLISKGDVTADDFDKNGSLFDETFFKPSFLAKLNDGVIDTTNVLPGSITREELSDKEVTPAKISFLRKGKNLATGSYDPLVIVQPGGNWAVARNYGLSNGSMEIVKVLPDTTYTITNFEPEISNRFMIGLSKSSPEYDHNDYFYLDRMVKTDNVITPVTFTTDATTRFVYIFLSSEGKKPKIQVELGSESTEFVAPYYIPKEMLIPELGTETNKTETIKTVVEDAVTGYVDRPEALSVIWIGPNEPTGAEPYDEWRESKGFIYFDDFEDDIAGAQSQPAKWQDKLSVGDTKSVMSAPNSPSAGNVLRWRGVNTRHGIEFKDSQNDSRKDNGEVFFIARSASIQSSILISAILNGGGDTGKENGYIIGPRPTTTTGSGSKELRVSKYENGAVAVLATFVSDVDFSEYFCIRARVDDNQIKAKVWQYGVNEPDWQIDITDPLKLESGFIGLFNYLSIDTFVDVVGIGTGGMRAPTRRLI